MKAASALIALGCVAWLAAGCAVAQGKYQPDRGPAASRFAAPDTAKVLKNVKPEAIKLPGDSDTRDAWNLDIRAAEMAQQRVLVYSAQLDIAVANTVNTLGDIEKLAGELGGYVHQRTGETVTIRVPADKFNAATDRLARMGQVLSRSIQAQDVTEDYVDLKMRLTSSQAMLTRLQALLDKADMKQALEIEQQIGKVMTEIERLQGLIRLLDNRVALSTITVSVQRLAEAPRSALLGRKLPFDWLHSLGLGRLLDY